MSNDEQEYLKLPPHDIDAELCLLGSLMLITDPLEWASVASLVSERHFYRSDHGEIFKLLREMRANKKPVDAVTYRAHAISKGSFESLGGMEYLTKIITSVPSSAHAKHYAEIVRNHAMGRAIIHLATRAIADVHSERGEFLPIATRLSSQFTKLAVSGQESVIRSIGEGVREVVERATNKTRPPLISTGLQPLDDVVGGYPIGGFSIISGRPAMGKSAVGKCSALALACQGTPVGVISIEETLGKISTNVLSNIANVQSAKIAFARESEADLKLMLQAAKSLENTPMFIADYPTRTSEIEATIAMMRQRYGCVVVFVDHLHIVSHDDAVGNRAAQLVAITTALKNAAKRSGVAVVALAQLNRGAASEGAKSRKPTLWDLKESGSLEENGDLIIGVHREDYYRAQRGESDFDHQMILCVLKNKLGGIGEVPMHWDGDHQRITEWIEDVP